MRFLVLLKNNFIELIKFLILRLLPVFIIVLLCLLWAMSIENWMLFLIYILVWCFSIILIIKTIIDLQYDWPSDTYNP